ncbi:flippase-like domain-containing protein [Acidobacteria bacterium AH-259-L09]|nr:flippase-like domain-containing protein [Acidobacteria bacterium AH-259-L09]
MSYRAKILIKATITIALLSFLGYQMDLGRFVQILSSANLLFVLLATLVHIVSVFLLVLRWRMVLRNFDISIEFVPLTKITFIGYFFNLFLPSGIGGDFFRAYYLSKRKNRGMSTTLTTTILERSAGMCALLAIGTFFAATHNIVVEGVPLFSVFLFVIALYALGNVVLFHSWTHQRISSFLRKRKLEQWEAKMELVYQGLNTLRNNKRTIVAALLLSLVIQFLAIIITWIAALAIEIQAPFRIFLIFVPLINLSIMVPVTIAGIGLQESLYYLLFSQIGLPAEMAVSLGVLARLVYILTAIPGGIIYSLYKKEEHLDEILAEAESS